MKYIKTNIIDYLSESVEDSTWTKGYKNNKLFVIYGNQEKMYINGCRNCNTITPIKNTGLDRQRIGNVYQSLCNCTICNEPMVYDEHNIDTLNYYLDNKQRLDNENDDNIKPGLAINITFNELSSSLKPTEIVKCEPFEIKKYSRSDEKTLIDTLYVYAKKTNTDDLMDNPLNNYTQNLSSVDSYYHIIINLKKKVVHYPYPDSEIERKFPKEVAKIFRRYVSEYTK